jgi:hypothetical protein
MRVRIRATRALTAAASLLLLAGFLTGCDNKDTGQKPTPPPVVSVKPTERVELMPDSSPEFLRRHFTDANGFEVETRIEYRNGDRAIVKFRADQTQETFKRTAKDGTVLIEQNFAADGKSIVSGRELRPDGTLKWQATQDSSGAVTTVTYWYDGKTVFSERTAATPGGAWTGTYFRKDGKIWVKRSGSTASATDREEQYTVDGKLYAVIEQKGTEMIATLYRADGTVQYKQHMVTTTSSYGSGYTYKTMATVDEFDTDGKTLVRTLVMNSGGYTVASVIHPNADGTATVRTLRWDGVVTHEEVRDSSGKIISQKNVDPAANIKEQYDYRAVREPTSDDPVNNWEMQEKYPYYRR